jgi:aryl-alcohol dehydrogenase-like predicted oxidoreductase
MTVPESALYLVNAIPGIDKPIFRICLGTAHLGSVIPRDASFMLLDAFLAQGGTLIDTAKVYSDWLPGERSRSEKLIGAWLRARGNRDLVQIATKGAHLDIATRQARVSPAFIAEDLDASLHNLAIDRIDLYWLHRDDPSQPVEPLIDALNAHLRAGKIGAFGASNWSTARLRAAHAYAVASGQVGFAANQPMWSAAVTDASAALRLDPTLALMDAPMRTFHTETQLPCLPYSSQANGLFSKLAHPPAPAPIRTQLWQLARGAVHVLRGIRTMYPAADNRRRFIVIKQIAKDRGISVTQCVLAYLLSAPFPVVPIIGSRTQEQLADSLSAARVRLSAAELAAIDAS